MNLLALAAAANPTAPVAALLDRTLPGLSSHFQLHIDAALGRCFSVDDVRDLPGHQITVFAGDASTLAAAVGYYLRERANLTIGWPRGGGSRIAKPAAGWPTMDATGGRADICRAVPHSYVMNVCTHSYSLVWYSWSHWEGLLDWMALRGVNLFLALTGQEEVQYRAFQRFGLDDATIRGWFNGPAFLTWSRGQNEYGAGIAGPLPRSFMKSQFTLQQRILNRSRSLGLIGQLPGFQGNVPIELKALLKDTNITKQGKTGWMDSLDPNFGKVADVWMSELTKAFGSDDHWYQLDGYFNGGTAPWLDGSDNSTVVNTVTDDPLWKRRGTNAYMGLNRTDPHAIWSFQGFAFEFWKHTSSRLNALKGFIDSAPKDKFVIIDMDYNEGEWLKWNSFFDTPFVWSKLHEFGGTDGMKGNMTRAAELPSRALHPKTNIVGTGFTSEGIDQNPAYYDLILDSHFHNASLDPTAYAITRALKRYNIPAAAAATERAWTALTQSVYSKDESVQDTTGVPHLPGTAHWGWLADRYTPSQKMCLLYEAWGDLIKVAQAATTSSAVAAAAGADAAAAGADAAADQATSTTTLDEPLRYDLIDVGREVLAQIATPLSMNLSDAFKAVPHEGSSTSIKLYGDAYVEVLNDLDTLVASDQAFLLGSWLQMARDVGSAHLIASDSQQPPRNDTNDCTGPFAPTIPPEVVGCEHFYEWNARCQLTTWNPVPKGAVKQPGGPIDYASKHWSGLINDYYKERAVLLIAKAKKQVSEGRPFTKAMDDQVRASHAFEFQVSRKMYPTKPVGDALDLSVAMRRKYAGRFAVCEMKRE